MNLEWVNTENLIDYWNHPTAEAWVEEHKNPKTSEDIYIAIDTSGCNGGLIGDGIYNNFADACNAVGERYGFNSLWVKMN